MLFGILCASRCLDFDFIQKAIPTIFLLKSDPVVHSIFNCDIDPTDVKSLND